MSAYSDLSRAQLSYEYLHTNSTTHEFLFGALAELVDNSRDAGASRIDVYTVPDKLLRGGHMLCFLDDGEGMNPQQVSNVITFGCSIKKGLDSKLIGQYGNGLKSGSMRIGNDVIMFTKKENTMTCMMISRTFHEQEKISEVIVPLPSFSAQNHSPLIDGKKKAKDRHELEMDLILKYSPFHSRSELFAQFQKITGQSGTLVIIYNLKLLDTGECELDFKTEPYDILLTGLDITTDKKLVPQRRSFRSYVSILYSEPRMKIYIQGQKVQLIKFINHLYKPRCYQYTSARFKTRSKEESKKADQVAKDAKLKAQEAEGNARQLEKQFLAHPTNKEGRAKLRTAQKEAEVCQEDARIKEMIAEQKRKALKEPKTLSFIFGINLENRNLDGLFIYNCCRLIKMYERVGPLLEDGISYRGVVGIVDVPYIVLEPTHNKQDFADAKEYRHLLKSLSEHLEQYWRDLGLGSDDHDVKLFWESYGYLNPSWDEPASNDPKYIRKRAMQRSICIQCDACLKWRILPFSSSHVGMKFPDNWVCSMNSDVSHNRCSAVEEKYVIPEGKLQKVEKTKPQKKELLDEKIRKLERQRSQIEEEEIDLEPEEEDEEEEMQITRKLSSSFRKQKSKVPHARKISRSKSSETVRKSQTRPIPRRLSARNMSCDDTEEEYEIELAKVFVPEEVVEKPRRISRDSIQKERVSSLLRQTNTETNKRSASDVQNLPAELTPKRTRYEPHKKKPEEDSMKKEKEITDWDPWPDCSDDDEGKCGSSKKYEVGLKVEARVKDKWYLGTVKKVSSSDYVQVKFDKFPDDKFDKQFLITSQDIKLPNFISNSVGALPSSTAVASSQEPVLEMPSSSTSFANQNFEHLLDEISRGYRTCLHYFLPPEWIMDRDGINALSPQELSTFPLDDFFDHYEKGLRKLVESFREDAEMHQKEAENAKASQKNTSRLIARLLNSIHEECNLDPEKDLDKVDELLVACVEQAEQSACRSS